MAGGGELSIVEYAYKSRPSTVLNSVFMSTVNAAAKSLVSVASNAKMERSEKWRPSDHLRYMVMLMTWTTVWVLRVLMDHLPCPKFSFSPHSLLGGFSPIKTFHDYLALLPPPSSSSSTALTTCGSSMDIILEEDFDGPTIKGLGRALTHILALINDIPATSRKYQFAMAMADRIMDGNFRDGHQDLADVNRAALSWAFARTLGLLYRSLQNPQMGSSVYGWTSNVIKAIPLGSYVASYMKGINFCLTTVMQAIRNGGIDKRLMLAGGAAGEGKDDVRAEKLAQELLWITTKLRTYGAIDEAMVHWGFATGLASLAHTANPRVQGLIVKISAILLADLPKEEVEVSGNVKFRLLGVWMPLFCHANNGLSYPVLTSFEKFEVERAMDEVISTLPAIEQEVILTNWLQDFTVSASEWPNLQSSYDRWCQSTRALVF